MIKYCCNKCGAEVKIDKKRIMNYTDITVHMSKYSNPNGGTLESESRCIFCESCMEEIRKFCKA